MKQHSKLRHQETQENALQGGLEQKSQAREFSSVEEMLQFDASNHAPPDSVAQRLTQSLEKEPAPKSWIRRLFGL